MQGGREGSLSSQARHDTAWNDVQQGEFVMNGLLIVFAAALLLCLPLFNRVGAAGPCDGKWTGTATSAGARCKRAVITLTVKGRDVSGQSRFERCTVINGTVIADGAVGATIGFSLSGTIHGG